MVAIETFAESDFTPCRIMELPESMWEEANRVAVAENPANGVREAAPVLSTIPSVLRAAVADMPWRLTANSKKYWGAKGADLTVSFEDQCPESLKTRILFHLNAWNTEALANVKFHLVGRDGDVRIGLDPRDGHYSYMGTDIRLVPRNVKTMNLAVDARTPDAELRRVVTHEGGHTLGFEHEHLRSEVVARIDPALAYRYFAMTQGWDEATTRNNVLTPLSRQSMTGTTEADEESVMCYQLPGSIMRDRKPVTGGRDLTKLDKAFAAKLYPVVTAPPPPPPPEGEQAYIKLVFEKGKPLPHCEVFVHRPHGAG